MLLATAIYIVIIIAAAVILRAPASTKLYDRARESAIRVAAGSGSTRRHGADSAVVVAGDRADRPARVRPRGRAHRSLPAALRPQRDPRRPVHAAGAHAMSSATTISAATFFRRVLDGGPRRLLRRDRHGLSRTLVGITIGLVAGYRASLGGPGADAVGRRAPRIPVAALPARARDRVPAEHRTRWCGDRAHPHAGDRPDHPDRPRSSSPSAATSRPPSPWRPHARRSCVREILPNIYGTSSRTSASRFTWSRPAHRLGQLPRARAAAAGRGLGADDLGEPRRDHYQCVGRRRTGG